MAVEHVVVDDAAFDTFVPTSPTDFDRGEMLVAAVYEALRANPELFATTILLITYDEHGGLYDHLPALERVPAPGTRRSLSARILDAFFRESARRFDFTRLGVRVPTLAVSPLVGRGVLVSEVFEHASVPATLRAVFAPNAAPLTRRDAHARTFHHLWDATPVRTDLPDLSGHTRPQPGGPAVPPPVEADEAGGPQPGDTWTPSYYREFLAQADAVRRHLRTVGEPEAADLETPTTRRNEAALDDAFARAARRHRRQPG